jgi:hypothetical protein
MALFYGGAMPLHRQLKGLLLPGLPRGQIPPKGGGGLPLPRPALGVPSQLFLRHPERRHPEPSRAVEPRLVRRFVDHRELLGAEPKEYLCRVLPIGRGVVFHASKDKPRNIRRQSNA